MNTAPRRFKDVSELSVEEHVQRMQAKKRGEAEPKFETEEYRQARRRLLSDFGFEGEEPPTTEKPIEEMTQEEVEAMSVDDHLEAIQRKDLTR